MKLTVCLEVGDSGSAIEMADAIIRNRMDDVRDSQDRDAQLSYLSEIAEHIQVYLKHNRAGVDI